MDFYVGRYLNRERLKFDCEVVTPMFLGGANGKTAELRSASIKGMLRFWWRALYEGTNQKDMLKEEGEIFGSTDRKSEIKIKVNGKNINGTRKILPRGSTFQVHGYSVSIIDYLGYGFYDYERGRGNVYNREYILPNEKFELSFEISKEALSESQIDSVKKAIVMFARYGNLGSRSRNGFGSIFVKSKAINMKPSSEFSKVPLKKWTAFSQKSKLFVFSGKNSWEDALSEIGMAYRKARLSLEQKHQFKQRSYVARPLDVRNESEESYKDRHAKSYFLRINKVNGKYEGQILYLPYDFHEQGKKNIYLDVYEKMNEYIAKKAKEQKNVF